MISVWVGLYFSVVTLVSVLKVEINDANRSKKSRLEDTVLCSCKQGDGDHSHRCVRDRDGEYAKV